MPTEQTRLSSQQPTMSYANTARSLVPATRNSAFSMGNNTGFRERAIVNYLQNRHISDGLTLNPFDATHGVASTLPNQESLETGDAEICCTSVFITIEQHRSDDKHREIEVSLRMPSSALQDRSYAIPPLQWASNVLSGVDHITLERWTKLQGHDGDTLNRILAPCGPDHPYSLLRDADAVVTMGEWSSSSRSSSNSSSHSAAEIIVSHPDRVPTRIFAAPGDRVIVRQHDSEIQSGRERGSFENHSSLVQGMPDFVSNPSLRMSRERQLLSTVSSHANGGPSTAGRVVTSTEPTTHSQLGVPTHSQTVSTAFSNRELASLIRKLADEGKIIIPNGQDQTAIAHGSLQSEADVRVSGTHAGRHDTRSGIPGSSVSSNTGPGRRRPDVRYILPDSSLLSRGSEGPASSVPRRRFQGQPKV